MKLKGKELEKFNICNLGISTEENIIYISQNVFIEMFKSEDRFNYLKQWLCDVLFELANQYETVSFKIREE